MRRHQQLFESLSEENLVVIKPFSVVCDVPENGSAHWIECIGRVRCIILVWPAVENLEAWIWVLVDEALVWSLVAYN